MSKLDQFFLRNLSYCAALKHRTPFETIYNEMSSNHDQIITEIYDILKSRDDTRLIYFFIVDKKTKENLEKILNNFTFLDFFPYFESCKKSILDDNYNLEYMFQFINFFHLIGSLRIIKDCQENRDQINDILLDILCSDDFPLLLQYSASQIFVDNDLGNCKIIENEVLEKFYKNLIKYIEKDSLFTHFVGLYSMYYNSFAAKTNIISQLYHKIYSDAQIDANRLLSYLPQLHCILRRLHRDTFVNEINKDNKFTNLYHLKDYDVEFVKESFQGIESLL